MVYYYTSNNVKLIRSLMLDYRAYTDITAHEYMKTYFESCPQNIDDSKISWIIDTFQGIHKHVRFLNEVITLIGKELPEDDKDYFTIIFHAIIFQIIPKDTPLLYKCLFNLSKPLLETFTKNLSNFETLSLISQKAQVEYDTSFVTENITSRLFSWLPFISDMNHDYEEHLDKIEARNRKKPTVPMQLNVLRRTSKVKVDNTTQNHVSDTSPNAVYTERPIMLTNSKIIQNVKRIQRKNKQKALNLNNIVNNNKVITTSNSQISNEITEKYVKTDNDSNGSDFKTKQKKNITPMKILNVPKEIKTTAATIKRTNEIIKQHEQGELKWFQDLLDTGRDMSKIEELLIHERQEKEKERLLDIERKHLMGQISYEEAVIAKKNLYQENKKKIEEFLKEKELWEKEIDKWKEEQLKKNREQVEKLSLIELDVIAARNNITLKRKENAEKLRQDSKDIQIIVLKNKQDELERRISMIKDIRMLAVVAKKSKMPKIIDLTESSGLGFLCEMSIAELQERLVAMKIGFKEELEEKKNKIKTLNLDKKYELEVTKKYVDDVRAERANDEKRKKLKPKIKMEVLPTKEINQLKNILLEKRNQRMLLSK